MHVDLDLETIHKYGFLHESVAVVLHNKDKEILLCLRNAGKIEGGKWDIAGAHILDAINIDAEKCLKRELNLEVKKLDYLGNFNYLFNSGDLIDNELVHVVIAEYNDAVLPNRLEFSAVKWVKLGDLKLSCDNAFWLNEGIESLFDGLKYFLHKDVAEKFDKAFTIDKERTALMEDEDLYDELAHPLRHGGKK